MIQLDGDAEAVTRLNLDLVDRAKNVRGDTPVLRPWIFGYLENPDSYTISDDDLQSYGAEIGYYLLPGLICFVLTILLFICCIFTRCCCPTCCCKVKHPTNYKCGEKARPEICFGVSWVFVLISVSLGIYSFSHIGRGFRLLGCDTEVFIDDATKFVTDLNTELQGINSLGTSSLDSVSNSLSSGVSDITAKKEDMVTKLNSFVTYSNTMTIDGTVASSSSSSLNSNSISSQVTTTLDQTVDKLVLLQKTVADSIVTPRESMNEATEQAGKFTEEYLKQLDGARDKLVYDPFLLPSIPLVTDGLFFSKTKFNGINEMFSDAEQNSNSFGLIPFLFSLLAFPLMLIGLIFMHFHVRDPKGSNCGSHCALGMGRVGCVCLLLGMLLCFLLSTVLLGSGLLFTDVCMISDDFLADTTQYTSKMEKFLSSNSNANDGGGRFLMQNSLRMLQSNTNSTDLSAKANPAKAIDACFNGNNLIDALGMDIIGSSFDDLTKEVKGMDVAAQFQSQEYSDFDQKVQDTTEDTFGWENALFVKLKDSCENSRNFEVAVQAAKDTEGTTVSSAEINLAVDCDKPIPPSATSCDTLQGKICDFRNIMAKKRWGCSDPLKKTKNECTGNWNHDNLASTAEIPRVWIDDSIDVAIQTLNTQWSAVDISYQNLQTSAVSFRDNLVSEEDNDQDGKKDGALLQVEPFLGRVNHLGNFTYCNFVKTHYQNTDKALCGHVLMGMLNTAFFMWVSAFLCFFVIDAMFFLEIRIGGVGAASHPLLKHPTFHIDDGPQGDMPGLRNARSLSDLVVNPSRRFRQNERNAELELSSRPADVAVAVPITTKQGQDLGMVEAGMAQPLKRRFDTDAIEAARAGATPEEIALATIGK
eukprot:g3006.t1